MQNEYKVHNLWDILKKNNDLDLSANDTIIILNKDDLKFLRTEKVFNVLFPNLKKKTNKKSETPSNNDVICPGISELDGYLRSLEHHPQRNILYYLKC